MHFSSGSFLPNELPNFMPMPPHPLPQYHQEDKETTMNFSMSVLPNELPKSMLVPPYQLSQYHQEDKERQTLQQFWHQQLLDIQNTEAFKSQQQLPLSRIKRIVKADKDVKMVSAEVPLFMAKACEIFIQELTLRAWMYTEENERCTLQNRDIAKAVEKKHVLRFLTDVVHCDLLLVNKHQEIDDGKEGNQSSLSDVAGSTQNTQLSVGEMVTTNNQIPQPQMMLLHFDPFTYSFFQPEETNAGKEENLASLFDVAASKENTMANMAMTTSTSMEDKMENMGEMVATNQGFPQPRMMLSDFDPFQYNFFQPE